MAKLINPLYPFGAHCLPLEGEVSEETKRWLLDSERATEADFEQEEIKNTKPKKINEKINFINSHGTNG